MIKVDRVSKKYDNDFVLNNLSFNIKDNCIYGLVGANGAGKSTLLRIIMGIFDANMGSVTIDGEEVSHNVKLKQKMVFIPDDLFFYPVGAYYVSTCRKLHNLDFPKEILI